MNRLEIQLHVIVALAFRIFLWIIFNTQGKLGPRLCVTSVDDHIWASSQPDASDLPLSYLLVRGIEYLSTVAVGRRKSTKPAPFILVPLYLDSLHPVNCEVVSNKFFTPSKNRMSEYFDGDQYMKRLADREKAIPRDSPLLIQVSVGVCLFETTIICNYNYL